MLPFIPVLLSASALVWSAPKAPTRAALIEEYKQTFALAVAAAAKAFREDRSIPSLPLPQDPQIWSLYAGLFSEYSVFAARMSYIQAGRGPEDSPADFELMIRQVACHAHVDEDGAVRLYGERLRLAGPFPGDRTSEAALRAGLIAEMLNEKRVPPDMQKTLATKLDRMRQALGRSLHDEGASIDALERSWITQPVGNPLSLDSFLPRVQPVPLKIHDVPQPPTLQDANISAFLDFKKAAALGLEAWRKATDFGGRCLHRVWGDIRSVLHLKSSDVSGMSLQSAYQFSDSLNRDPRLFDKLKLRKIDPSTLPDGIPPVGAIINYGRGMCGFSPKHGHIEIVVSTRPPRTCSDGCMRLTPSRLECIKKYSPQNSVNVYVPVRDTGD